jgi:putative transposase
LYHSDLGNQYISLTYQVLLAQFHIEVSTSGKGDCYDNAMMESFTSLVQNRACESAGLSEAKQSIFEWTLVFYNRPRHHSSLG